ncbi:MAG: Ig-like domain-containing protein [Deltaproteobacteria bacterium]|nr:Ig-like domain-containing protein [Deltaproteobacteria bacterium]
MVRQVRMKETFSNPGSTSTSERRVFAFGTHPMASEAEAHPVMSATASGNGFRVIMDELLVGNHLEEIACRAPVDTDAFARVPLGATPDDVARCSAAQDILPRTCGGENAVCLCDNDAGCTVGVTMVAKGAPVGVLDINQDGAGDETRLIDGAVTFRCGALTVPMDLDASYWNPSGNQQVPAMGGFEALGPALVMLPQRGLPTNVTCQLEFGADVVDKQGLAPCTPLGGNIEDGCTPGDTTGFTFKVEPMSFENDPPNMATGVSKTTQVVLLANTQLDMTSVTTSTVVVTTTAPAVVPTYTLSVMMNRNITITFAAPLTGSATYTVTLTTGVKDSFGQPLPTPYVITFTTAA